MALEMDSYIPATPFGIMEMLKRNEIDISGKHCVVIGSNIVGRPISILMSQKGNPGNATVTVAHSRTKNIEQLTQKADIIVSALGILNFKRIYGKRGVIVIDVELQESLTICILRVMSSRAMWLLMKWLRNRAILPLFQGELVR